MSAAGTGAPRALLLDALGTLVELPPPASALREELAERCGVEVTLEQAHAAIVAEITYYRARFAAARDMDALRALRRACAEVIRGALPSSPALQAAPTDTLVEVLLGALRFRAYPDAAACISAARSRGLRVVVASNWDISLPDVLAACGLAELLDGIACSAAVGAAKPDARLFEAALSIAGVPAAQALHVGDSPLEDIAGARAAGIRPVLISRDGAIGPIDGVPTVASLADVIALTA